ncbi:hypothetical protein SPOG_04988 [Schizosaccharomyces cryophilus OY26]|uniref:Uncharacterized protein n=1 Tax=Schizosaccharomyces cryophilus (strain OY26 / ATCC MYA-4695 / CBS 11777 / NBRC 106824 / NRRL Y48691) TaxID=653667 RepID=S9WWP1_SCHCR|nr:uncharacterized protein SPOG_04988 [Schizosaccharomyces cryophilus OY26]EPY49162.1 hypothetical protein SPOG_04988 [Schizosaccharomyces cryophilus OY26]
MRIQFFVFVFRRIPSPVYHFVYLISRIPYHFVFVYHLRIPLRIRIPFTSYAYAYTNFVSVYQKLLPPIFRHYPYYSQQVPTF